MDTNILVVDDSNLMRTMIRVILTKAGFKNFYEAENGKIAVERYKAFKPGLITMDINMPEMNGLAAVKEIIKINPGAKIIMVTSMGQQSFIIEAIEAGAKDFVVKPFEPRQVLEAVYKVLSQEEM